MAPNDNGDLRAAVEKASVELVDLDQVHVVFRGERLTEARAEAIAAELLARADSALAQQPRERPALED
ncbi:MAG: hypothetical protein KQH57_12845 [Actinomycetales bacterium]|nr:hypothetical protein [Actinomycetales bacterium]